MIEFQYLEAMSEYNLKLSELPEDAQIGISNINDVIKRIKVLENKGESVSDKTIKKLKAMDKWVLYEIYDMVNDTDKNDDDIPFDAEDVIDDLEPENNESKAPVLDSKGLKIESDLKRIYESGKKNIYFDELKELSKISYDVIFSNYDESGDNGIETSNFSLLETEENVFTLTKK